MLQVRKAAERSHAQFEWLNSYHSFSFDHYYDPQQMGWGALRVINDDTVAPKGGFQAHTHNNMAFISYMLEGTLEHKNIFGTSSVIRPGDVQLMETGYGIRIADEARLQFSDVENAGVLLFDLPAA